MKKEAVTV